jgi:hypothetical protein
MVVPLLGFALASCADDAAPPPAEEPTAADIGRVVCDAEGTHVETPSVRAQADGVHLVVVNRLGFDTGFSMGFAGGGGGGENAPQGESSHLVLAPPGELGIGCSLDPAGGGEVEHRILRVVDPDGWYRPAELDCESWSQGFSDYGMDAVGRPGEPEEVARERFDSDFGLIEGDVVERAGYPDSETPIVRLVRDGRVLATISYRRAGDGGWLEDTMSKCDELQPA